ncbi:MAG: hypothetical protein QW228_03290 [Candidatus Aenigmatarchaeota archaeon]
MKDLLLTTLSYAINIYLKEEKEEERIVNAAKVLIELLEEINKLKKANDELTANLEKMIGVYPEIKKLWDEIKANNEKITVLSQQAEVGRKELGEAGLEAAIRMLEEKFDTLTEAVKTFTTTSGYKLERITKVAEGIFSKLTIAHGGYRFSKEDFEKFYEYVLSLLKKVKTVKEINEVVDKIGKMFNKIKRQSETLKVEIELFEMLTEEFKKTIDKVSKYPKINLYNESLLLNVPQDLVFEEVIEKGLVGKFKETGRKIYAIFSLIWDKVKRIYQRLVEKINEIIFTVSDILYGIEQYNVLLDTLENKVKELEEIAQEAK